MKIRFLRGPWPFAIAGALLILSSTFLLGVIAFREEQALLKVQKDLEVIDSKRQEAQHVGFVANMQIYLASLQRAVVKYGVFQDVNLQKRSHRAFSEALYAALLKLYVAAGRDFTEQVENLKDLSSKAIEGDNDALQKLSSLILEMTLASGKYVGDLIVEKAKLEKTEERLKRSIINLRKWALFLQIVGLLLLLTKEFPDYVWGAKRPKKD